MKPSSSSVAAAGRGVEIVGGGLAGLSLGLALRRAGVPVILHEAGEYPRHRVCGEFIAGLDERTRGRLGLDPVLKGAGRRREVAWSLGGRVVRRQMLPAPALALSRHELDRRLADAFVEAGGELRVRSRVESRIALPGRVFAQGRSKAADSPWLGLKCHARGLRLEAGLELHLGRRAYVGLCEVEEGRVNVSGLFHRRAGLTLDRASALQAYLRSEGFAALAERLEGAGVEIDPESRCAVAGLRFGRSRGGEDGAAGEEARMNLGDAHALTPPFTGNGMAMAFQAAEIALDPLTTWARGEVAWPVVCARVRRDLRARFRARLAAAGLLHGALLQPWAQRGLVACARARLLPLDSLYRALH
jgi:hypothetical protein